MKHIQSVCDSLGFELHDGEIHGRCRPEDLLAETIIDVAQASLRIAALWEAECAGRFEAPTSEVADFLRSQGWAFCQEEELEGCSGDVWTVDFSIATGEMQALVYVLSTSNPNDNQMIAEYVADAWQDLSHLRVAQPSTKFISLIDNTTGGWNKEQIDLPQASLRNLPLVKPRQTTATAREPALSFSLSDTRKGNSPILPHNLASLPSNSVTIVIYW